MLPAHGAQAAEPLDHTLRQYRTLQTTIHIVSTAHCQYRASPTTIALHTLCQYRTSHTIALSVPHIAVPIRCVSTTRRIPHSARLGRYRTSPIIRELSYGALEAGRES
eukprot:2258739-Rhodomonas_salina.4